MPSGRHSRTLTWGRGNSPHVDITAATPDQSFASSMMDHAPSGSLARAVQLAVAYDIEHHSHQPGKLQQLLRLQGNMRTRYQRGIKQMGGFLTKYPEAAAELLQWAKQDAMHIDQILGECNAVLTMQPSVPTNSAITATTVQPGNNPNEGAINSKRSCDKGLGAQMKGSTEVKRLAVALTTSGDPRSTLNCIKRHEANLYQALALQHLGRVIIAGMISWDTLMHWTVAQPPQQETGRATVPCAAGASRTAPDASNTILHPTQQVRQETGGTERRL